MLEKEIEKKICEYATKKHNAICYKFTSPNRRSVPDRMVVFPHGLVIFIEFKAPGKTPTPAQEREIARLQEREQTVLVIDNVERGKDALSWLLEGK